MYLGNYHAIMQSVGHFPYVDKTLGFFSYSSSTTVLLQEEFEEKKCEFSQCA